MFRIFPALFTGHGAGQVRLLLCCLALSLSLACAAKAPLEEPPVADADQPVAQVEEAEEATPPEGEALEAEVLVEDTELAAVQGWSPEQRQALENVPPGAIDARSKENEAFYRFFYYFTAKDESGQPIKGRNAMINWLRRAQVYLPSIRQVLRERNLPEELAYLPFVESGFNSWVYSHAGAGGMWQFMPGTARDFGMRMDWWVDERRNPYQATMAAAQYLADLKAMFGDWYLALAAYNAGEGKISRCLKATGCDNYFDLSKQSADLKTETKDYVPKFLAFVRIMRNLEVLGFETVRLDASPGFVRLEAPPGTDLDALAAAAGMSFAEFNHYNPAFRRKVSPVDRPMPVWLPGSAAAGARGYLANPGSRAHSGWYMYTAAKRDTWANLAQRSGVPAEIIMASNGGGAVSPGQRLRIPNDGRVSIQPLPEPKPQKALAAKGKGAKAPPAGHTGGQAGKAGGKAVDRPATYTAQRGDTLFSIAQRFDVNLDELRAANRLSKGDVLGAGQVLALPGGKPAKAAAPAPAAASPAPAAAKAVTAAPDKTVAQRAEPQGAKTTASARTHQVQQGETLYSIARRYNIPPDRLMAHNRLGSGAVIRPGEVLRLP